MYLSTGNIVLGNMSIMIQSLEIFCTTIFFHLRTKDRLKCQQVDCQMAVDEE